MAKKKRRKTRRKQRSRIPPITRCDRHHICFTKSQWNKGYAKAICMAFVRYVPVVYHRELHTKLKTVPVPDASLLKKAWLKYEANKPEIDSYDVARAAAWLYVNIPDEAFCRAMQVQIDYFATLLDKTI